jgi:alkylation response protein AidB-like acyl-CoA dehydrogenase
MTTLYDPPLGDIQFALEQLADLPSLSKLPTFAHADPDTVRGLLEEFGRFVAEVLAPLNRVGDLEGSRIDSVSGQVTTPTGWRDAYVRYVDAGWGSVPFPADYGGGGFPWLLAVAMQELLTSTNMAFALCPMLTQGAIHLLTHHGSVDQRERYVPKMISGEWTGTMNLTEPHAGSDVGALTTKATPAEDGTWRINGQKIFITYGEHDLTGNIVHLVLARVAGAPPGSGGISCFIVPKYLLAEDGSPGPRNGVRCLSIEHKLGIHASPTCVLEYDDAVGELVGEPNAGLRYMFTMMNNARLSVGVQGLAISETAYQQAWRYATERIQGRTIEGGGPIADHPDVRRMLLTMRSQIEAMRGLCYLTAQAIDLASHAHDENERQANQELADLLTPISKAWCTDLGTEITSLAVQVHGGMGYIEETGIAQHYRDVRIAAIYEGTNGIQAMDLVGRKLGLRGGEAIDGLLRRIEALDAELADAGPALASIRAALADAVAALRESTRWLLEQAAGDRAAVLAGATPYLRQWGTVLGGWVLARQALAAIPIADDNPYLTAKVTTARFYCEQLLPQANYLRATITSGATRLFASPAGALASR